MTQSTPDNTKLMQTEKPYDFSLFDLKKNPIKPKWYLKPVAWLLSFPAVWSHRAKITKIGLKGLKPPYILLSNHNAFLDFKVATAATFPHSANYVVAIDGFVGRESLLRNVGCICKRKFTSDISLVKHISTVLKKYKGIVGLYPEARYSLCGTDSVLPESLGKLAKLMGVPLVMLKTHGHHINSPFWYTGDRKVPVQSEMFLIASSKELENLSVLDINKKIKEAFVYDDFAWQRENKVSVTVPNRAEGLHKVLYQCPACNNEYQMTSFGSSLKCEACGKEWQMTENGELKAKSGETEFSHIPDWYEWERANVRSEIESGLYSVKSPAVVESLPNSKGFIRLGDADFIHDMNGFKLYGSYEGKEYSMEKLPLSAYSVHIEYNYMNRGDCVDLNDLDKTYYIFLKNQDTAVTKISLASEEMYDYYMKQINFTADRTI